VEGWGRFTEVIELLVRAPLLVHDTLMIQGEFAARLADRVLRDVQVDAALFSEPIAEKRGPLISPKMYREIVLPSYDPLLSVLKRHGVEVIILVSWANPRLLKMQRLDLHKCKPVLGPSLAVNGTRCASCRA